MINFPKTLNQERLSEAEQLKNIRNYLYALADELQRTLQKIESRQDELERRIEKLEKAKE